MLPTGGRMIQRAWAEELTNNIKGSGIVTPKMKAIKFRIHWFELKLIS